MTQDRKAGDLVAAYSPEDTTFYGDGVEDGRWPLFELAGQLIREHGAVVAWPIFRDEAYAAWNYPFDGPCEVMAHATEDIFQEANRLVTGTEP